MLKNCLKINKYKSKQTVALINCHSLFFYLDKSECLDLMRLHAELKFTVFAGDFVFVTFHKVTFDNP